MRPFLDAELGKKSPRSMSIGLLISYKLYVPYESKGNVQNPVLLRTGFLTRKIAYFFTIAGGSGGGSAPGLGLIKSYYRRGVMTRVTVRARARVRVRVRANIRLITRNY